MAPAEPARITSGNGSRAASGGHAARCCCLMRSPEGAEGNETRQLHQQPLEPAPATAGLAGDTRPGLRHCSRSKRCRTLLRRLQRYDPNSLPSRISSAISRPSVLHLRRASARRASWVPLSPISTRPKGSGTSSCWRPNLTIYNKLIADFTPNTPKYVFQGIAEFANNPPEIITGDNYESGRGVRQSDLFGESASTSTSSTSRKINTEVRGGRSPRIKRLQRVHRRKLLRLSLQAG